MELEQTGEREAAHEARILDCPPHQIDRCEEHFALILREIREIKQVINGDVGKPETGIAFKVATLVEEKKTRDARLAVMFGLVVTSIFAALWSLITGKTK